jgi:hypothetical protein
MTRKDYVLIARAIHDRCAHCKDAGIQAGILDAADAIADALEKDNPRFDRHRFLRACLGLR